MQVDSKPARFGHNGKALTVTPTHPVFAGFTVEVRHGGNPRPVRSR